MSVGELRAEAVPVSAPVIEGVPIQARGVLTMTCPERPGIVQAVTSFLLKHDFDIVEHHQFDDSMREVLFLRTAFAGEHPFEVKDLTAEFASTAVEFSMNYAFYDETKPRLLVMVSPEPKLSVMLSPAERLKVPVAELAPELSRSSTVSGSWRKMLPLE